MTDLTTREAAARFHVSVSQLTRLARVPGCPARAIGLGTQRAHYRWPEEETAAWFASRAKKVEAVGVVFAAAPSGRGTAPAAQELTNAELAARWAEKCRANREALRATTKRNRKKAASAR